MPFFFVSYQLDTFNGPARELDTFNHLTWVKNYDIIFISRGNKEGVQMVLSLYCASHKISDKKSL